MASMFFPTTLRKVFIQFLLEAELDELDILEYLESTTRQDAVPLSSAHRLLAPPANSCSEISLEDVSPVRVLTSIIGEPFEGLCAAEREARRSGLQGDIELTESLATKA